MSRVLIVEDYCEIRHILRMILESQGYVCEEAENGLAGLDKVDAGHFDLILLDYHMPLMDGIQFLNTISTRAATCAIPVIMMTSDPTDQLRLVAINAGAVDFLVKPYDLDALLMAVPRAIRSVHAPQFLARSARA